MVVTTQTPLTISGFDGSGATIITKFPEQEIIRVFLDALQAEWTKRTRKMTVAAPVAVQGNFIKIDEGNRWLRYFLTFLAGHAILEVEGTLFYNGQQVDVFHLTKRQVMGIFGGDSKEMLKLCAKAAAADIVKKLIAKIK